MTLKLRPALKIVKRALRDWWRCRTKQCDYYEHYLVYGPADLTHIGWHKAEVRALDHFKNCSFSNSGNGPCPACLAWERRMRA